MINENSDYLLNNQENNYEKKEGLGRKINVSVIGFLSEEQINDYEKKGQNERVSRVVDSLLRENSDIDRYIIYTTGKDASNTGKICHNSAEIFASELRNRGLTVDSHILKNKIINNTKIKTRDELTTNEITPAYYEQLKQKAEEYDIDLDEAFKSQSGVPVDLWGKTPDIDGKIESPGAIGKKYHKFISKMEQISKRSNNDYPPVTILVITNVAINAWVTEQTGIPASQTGRFSDYDNLTVKFGASDPHFNFNGNEYKYKDELSNYEWENN